MSGLRQRITQTLALADIAFCALPGECSDPGDIAGPFGYADRAARVEEVEEIGRLDAGIIRRQRKPGGQQPFRFVFEPLKRLSQQIHVGHLEIIGRKFDFRLVMNRAIRDPIGPHQVEDIVDVLQVHRQAFRPIGDLDGDRLQLDAADFLKIRELCDLHAVEADFPSEAPGAERRGFPIVLNEPDVVLVGIDAKHRETVQVKTLDIVRRRFEDDLVLVIMLESVGVFPIPTVCGTPARLGIG
jgi:hypothetical protein